MSDSFDNFWNLTTTYRNGLRTMFNVVREVTGGCSCEMRDDWHLLMDNDGVPARDPRLTVNGVNCLCCQVESVYATAVGEDVLEAELLSEIKMRLGDHSVIAQMPDENGKMHYRIVRRDALGLGDDPSTD